MVNQVPIAAKIRQLQTTIDLLQQQAAVCNPQTMMKELRGFRYQEEVFMAILDDYRQVQKEMKRELTPKHI